MPTDPCAYCSEPFRSYDQGVILPFLGERDHPPELAYHHACFMETLGLATVRHVVRDGVALCGFSNEGPSSWPKGHVVVNNVDRATCSQCKRRWVGAA